MSIRDIGAAIVVFLVALPLCLGVALASLPVDPTTGEVPVGLGIISGVVGGVIVGALAGSPLQVSGPAAGLIASVLVMFGLDFFVHYHEYVGGENIPGFYTLFGFIASVILIGVAKIGGKPLKRKDDYYDE